MSQRSRRIGRCLSILLAMMLAVGVIASLSVVQASADPTSTPSVEIAYKNLSYSDSTYMLFAVGYQNFNPAEHEIKMLFWSAPDAGGYTKESKSAYVANAVTTTLINNVPHVIFYSRGIAAKNLIDDIYCRAYVVIDEVTYYSNVQKCSPVAYLQNIGRSSTQSEVNKNLAGALLQYAASAQVKFDYRTEELANATYYSVTLENATFEDGFANGLFKENSILNITATVPDGDSFGRWVDNENNTLGTNPELSFTVTGDITIRALLASNPDSCVHEYSAWIEPAEADCTNAGVVGHYHCAICGRNFDGEYQVIDGDVVLPALGHDLVHVDAQPATCVEGHTAYDYCTRCDYSTAYDILPATDPHSYVESTVEPVGEARGYTLHTCSVCGDFYRTNFDYSLYAGVDFTTAGKFAIPYNFDASVYTIEASVQLDPSYSSRAGVLIGNYDGTNPGFNLEVYTNGHLRLYFKINKNTSYSHILNTDIRSESIVNLAVTIERGIAKVYLDGVLTETQELADFDMPAIGRSLVLGGDNRTGNSQSFKGVVYSATIFRDIRTEAEIIEDLVLADADDPNCCVSYNLLTSDALIGSVVLDEVAEYAAVTNAEELAYHASHGTKNIEVMNNITLDRTVYVISDVVIYANGDYSITRDPEFLSDLFVVGENAAGRNLILDGIICELTLGKDGATGTLTIDGNKQNVEGEVYGSLVYLNNSGSLDIHDGAVLTNAKKTANARTLGMEQYYGNMAGGAAIVNVNGTVTMDGGLISYNETNFNDPGAGNSTSDLYLQSCYGGAVFNNSNFVMTGGSFVGNTGYYGGAIANFLECKIEGGVFDGNYTSHAGGAIYVYNADARMLTIGSEEGDPTDVIFRNNYTTESSGGAIYSGQKCYTIIYGGTTFDSNHTPGSGGAVYIGCYGELGPNTVFTGNTSGNMGGALYISATASDRRSTTLSGVTFTGNSAKYGGAAVFIGSDTTIENCIAENNTASVHGGAYYVNHLSDGTGAIVTMTGGSVSGNSATGEAGGLFADLNCSISITGTTFAENESIGNGGAISLHGVSALTLTGVTFRENATGTTTPAEGSGVSGNGGALYASYRTVTDNSDPENMISTYVPSSVTATNCNFVDNHSDGQGGAVMAIDHDNATTAFTVSGSTFSGNTADLHGGAIVANNTTIRVNNSTLSNNTAGANGGAIYSAATATLLSNGSTFTGNASNNSQYGGGALYFTNATGTLSGATFTGNTSNVHGGALAVYSGSNVTLTDTTATGNSAGASGGFALAYNSTLTMNATTGHRNVIGSLTNSELGNTARSGGAFYADTGAVINVSNADVGYNTTIGSGGAFYYNSASGTLDDCRVRYNASGITEDDTYGGAMMVGYGSNVTITDSDFTGNSATAWAGAIYVRHQNNGAPSTVTASGTTFADNSAVNGGAIYVRETCSFTATNCEFTGNSATSQGGAAYISGNGTFSATSTTFEDNTAAIGGAIFEEANATAQLTNATLATNSATGGNGGAVYAGTSATLTVSGSTFQENTASGTGGAIHLADHATLTSTDDSLFDRNTSVGIGGAVYVNNANASLTDTDFTQNATTGGSAWYGGAIYTNGASVLSVDSCDFTGNNNTHGTGGAICARGTGSLTVTDSTFTGNYASSSGGAIHVFGITATITDSTFTGNYSTGGNGGAIMSGKDNNDGTNLTVTRSSFSGNSATGGGAIYVQSGTALTLQGTTEDEITTYTILSENTAAGGGGGAVFAEANVALTITSASFDENSTTGSGGAIYTKENVTANITNTLITNCQATYGGAMIIYGSNVTITGGEISGGRATGGSGTVYLRAGANNELGRLTVNGTLFSGNTTAGNGGGAVYVNSNSTFTAENATFSGNYAAGGGAIYVNTGATFSATDCTFSANYGTGQGGAIYSNSGNVDLDGCTFTGNYGSGDGSYYAGAFYLNGTSVGTVNDCTFTENYSEKYAGGAISVRNTATLTITDSEFNGNYCKTTGGALYIFESANVSISGSSFTGNHSIGNGGAIQLGKTSSTDTASLTLTSCTFTSNYAPNGGAIALNGNVTMNATGTNFTSNSATSHGGAIYSYIEGTNETFTNCTFQANTATTNGGAIYHSCATNMVWTSVTMIENVAGGKGDAVYVTNGSGKDTHFTINSATFNQTGDDMINIGNSRAYMTVHDSGVTDVNHTPTNFSLIIIGTTSKVTHE